MFDEVEAMMLHYEAIGVSNDREVIEEQLTEIHDAGFILVKINNDVAEEKLRDLLMKWFKDPDDEAGATTWPNAQYLAENIAIDILTVLKEDV